MTIKKKSNRTNLTNTMIYFDEMPNDLIDSLAWSMTTIRGSSSRRIIVSWMPELPNVHSAIKIAVAPSYFEPNRSADSRFIYKTSNWRKLINLLACRALRI